MQPYEIIVSPFQIYLGPVGEPFSLLDDVPAGNFTLLGTSGKKNYAEDGVTTTHEQTINQIRTLGSTGPVKVTRPEENLTIDMILMDCSLEHYATILNNIAVNDVAAAAGTPGYREITLRQGPDVATFAMICKGVSPYGDGWYMQYQIPIVYQGANPAPVFVKGAAAALACTWTAIEDPNAATEAERFGKLVAQDAEAE